MAHSASSSSLAPNDGEYVGRKLEVFTAVFIPAQVAAVALRYYARSISKAPHGFEDWIVIVSLLCQIIMGSLVIAAVYLGGVGHHVSFLEAHHPEKLVIWGKFLVATSTLYFATVSLPKLALLTFYHRLFPGSYTRPVIKLTAGILICLGISTVISNLAACRPFEANWNLEIPSKCINKEALFIWSSFPNIFTDIVMLLLPLPVVWKLHTTKRLKAGLTVTFAIGSAGLITSILRFRTFFQNNSFTDGTFSAATLLILTQVETGVYLISACAVTYKPLLGRVGGTTISKITYAAKSRIAPGSNNQGSGKMYGSNWKNNKNERLSGISLKVRQAEVTGHAWVVEEGWNQLSERNSTEGEGITVKTDIRVASQDAKGL